MKGIRLVGILVMGVVWGGLAQHWTVEQDNEMKWMAGIANYEGAIEQKNDCFTNRRGAGHTETALRTTGSVWNTKTVASAVGKEKELAKHSYMLKEAYEKLWLAGIVQGCKKGGTKQRRRWYREEGWCRQRGYGPRLNIALPCTSEEHKKQFIKWSERVHKAQVDRSDENITFTEANTTHHSFFCTLPNVNETVLAEKDTPKYKQKIGKHTCTINNDETTTHDTSKYCYYNMAWLGEEVAAYKCEIRRAENCDEAIKRGFEVGQKNPFGAKPPTIDGEEKPSTELNLTDKNCTLQTDLPKTGRQGTLRFKFTNGSDEEQAGEIWCAFKPPEEKDTISCKFFSQCEAEIRNALGSEKAPKDVPVSVTGHNALRNDLRGRRCTRKQKPGESGNGNETFSFFFSDTMEGKTPDGELSCPKKQETPIKCTFSPTCAYTVKSTLWPGNQGDGKFDEKVADLGLDNATCRNMDESRGGSNKTFQITTRSGGTGPNPEDEISCENSGDTTIKCVQLPKCEVEIKKAFRVGNSRRITFDGQVKDEENEMAQIRLADFPEGCSKKDVSGAEGLATADQRRTFTAKKDDFNRTISCTWSDDRITCTLERRNCEQQIKKEFSIKEADTNVKMTDKHAGFELKSKKCTTNNPISSSTKFFKITGEGSEAHTKEISCTSDPENTINCRILSECEVAIRKGFNGQWKYNKVAYWSKHEEESSADALPPKCTIREDSRTPDGSTRKFELGREIPKEGQIWCTYPGQEGETNKITCKLFSPCEVTIREKFETPCKIDITKKLAFDGRETNQEDLPKECSSETENTVVSRQSCGTGAANLTFNVEKDPADLAGRKFTCHADAQSQISCTILPLKCEEMVQKQFGSCAGGKNVEFSSHIDGLSKKGKAPGDICPLMKTEPQTPSCETPLKFDITEEIGGNLNGRRISCTSSGGVIKCDLLPPTCREYVGEEFSEKCEGVTAEARNVEFEGDIKDFLPRGGTHLTDYCPLDPRSKGEEKCENKDNGKKVLLFTINSTDKLSRNVWCERAAGSGIACKLLPHNCSEKVEADYRAACNGQDGGEVSFGPNISHLANEGGKGPEYKCPLVEIKPQHCGQEKILKYTILVEKINRTVSCKLDSTSQISCKLLPKTCAQFVQTKFNATCGKKKQIEAPLLDKKDITNFGTLTLPRKEDEECPLQLSPEKNENCKNGGNKLTFKIKEGNEANKTLSCTFKHSKISCNVVALSCEQVIQKELLTYHYHFWDKLFEKVVMEKNEKNIELNKEECRKTDEQYKKGEKVFHVKNDEGKNSPEKETEILCQKEHSIISCTLLPPRCEINSYGRSDVNAPLRCNKTENGDNITFSRAGLEGKIDCVNKESQDNKVRKETCKVNVTKVGESKENTPFYCKKSDVKDIFTGNEVCTPLSMIDAKMCPLTDLKFENDSACDINETTGDLSIPKEIFKKFRETVERLRKQCTEKEDKHEISKDTCAAKILFAEETKEDKFFHCSSDNVKTFKKSVKQMCDVIKIPTLTDRHTYLLKETVKIHFQTEEHSDEKTQQKTRRLLFLKKPLSPPEPWDIDDSFASFYSPFYLLILALF